MLPCFHALKIFRFKLVFTVVNMSNCAIHDKTGIFRKIQTEVGRHSTSSVFHHVRSFSGPVVTAFISKRQMGFLASGR